MKIQLFTLYHNLQIHFFLLVCFKKKKNVHHALLQAAWHFKQEDFSPPSSLAGPLREDTRTLRSNSEGMELGPTNPIISSLGLVEWSLVPAYHVRCCPTPVELTAFLGLEGKPLRGSRICWIVRDRCYPFQSSEFWYHSWGSPEGSAEVVSLVAGTLNTEIYVGKPIQVLVSCFVFPEIRTFDRTG